MQPIRYGVRRPSAQGNAWGRCRPGGVLFRTLRVKRYAKCMLALTTLEEHLVPHFSFHDYVDTGKEKFRLELKCKLTTKVIITRAEQWDLVNDAGVVVLSDIHA